MEKTRTFSGITMLSAVLLNSLSPLGSVYANTVEANHSTKTSLNSDKVSNVSDNTTKASNETQTQQESAPQIIPRDTTATTLTDWNYTQDASTITLSKFKGSSTDLLIPGELEGKQVKITLDALQNLKNSNVTNLVIKEANNKKVQVSGNDLNSAFQFNYHLTAVDLSGLDVSDVTDVAHMFEECSNLTSVNDLSNWIISNVTDLSYMFNGCINLTSLDLSNWNTSNVRNTFNMFSGCTNLTSVGDLSNWDTSNVIGMYNMFNGCINLTSLDLSSWNTSNVTDMSYMFYATKNLRLLDLSNWNLSKITKMPHLFYKGVALDASKLKDEANYKPFKAPNDRQLLVIAKDESLKNYDYAADNVLPAGPLLDANGGTFEKEVNPLFDKYVVETADQAKVTKAQYEDFFKTAVNPPSGTTFIQWVNPTQKQNKAVGSNEETEMISILDHLNDVYYAQYGAVFPGGDGKLGTDDDVIVKPAPDSIETPQKDKWGNVVVPKDGKVVLPSSSTQETKEISPAEGSIVVPTGTTVEPNKEGVQPSVNQETGEVTIPAGSTVTLSNGMSYSFDKGGIVKADGTLITLGQVKNETTNVVITPNVKDGANGVEISPNGEVKLPNGGTVTNSAGKKQTVTDQTVLVKPDGTMTREDGTVIEPTEPSKPTSTKVVDTYRLYNKNTGEHFYTQSAYERDSLKRVGWTDEGLGWKAPVTGKPIYRLYNPNAKGGDHYYTMSSYEADSLVKAGWRKDNNGKPVFYSGGNVKVYVAYNPNAESGAHNYTTSKFEQASLLKGGWKYGAVAWYAN